MFNARAMGDAELEKLNKGFMWGTLAVLVIAILLAIFSGIKANFVGIAALGAWYGAVGRKQVALVKERYGSNYPRRSWGKPILFGVLGIVALYVCIFILLFIVS